MELPALISVIADICNIFKQQFDEKNLSRPTVKDAA